MNWNTIYALSSASSTILLGLVAVVVTFLIRDYDKKSKRYLCGFFSILIVSAIITIVDTVLEEKGGYASALSWLELFDYLVLLLLIPLLAAYVLFRAGKPIRGNRLFLAECGVSFVSAALNIGGVVAGFSEETGIPILLSIFGTVFPIAVYVIMVVLLIRYRKQFSPGRFVLFLLLLFAPIFSQSFLFGLLIVFDQGERYLKQKDDNLRKQAQITVLQMRPHFIYNTMMSVYYLCEQDAKKAQDVILDFTNYLRKNFSAVAKEGTIPFPEELEHAKAYLAVEKARFDDKLFVVFDTPVTGFQLPVLTLQPLVENAVKHGISPELDPLTVTVTTREANGGFELTVSDDGLGFSNSDNGEPHLALNNLRDRLSVIGASLTVSPRENGGTAIRIFIPKSAATTGAWKVPQNS